MATLACAAAAAVATLARLVAAVAVVAAVEVEAAADPDMVAAVAGMAVRADSRRRAARDRAIEGKR